MHLAGEHVVQLVTRGKSTPVARRAGVERYARYPR